MFFFFSKLLFFLTQPVNWIVFAFLAALFIKKTIWKRRLLRTGICLLLFFTNHAIFNAVANWWEPETLTADQIQAPYDIAILLGGFSNFSIQPSHDRYNLNQSAARLTQTLELYKQGKVKQILITSGTGAMLDDFPAEADMVKPFMMQMGVSEEDIIIENKSRNTYENALFTKEVLTNYPNASCLLITSASHMRRSKGCFDQQAIEYTPYAVDYIQEEFSWSPDFVIIPNSWALMRWGILTKEWVGYVAYWLKGYV
ncbi:MAG: YdcF family protein [Saprospiraceae bacterium]